jgi:hypothetical protein
LSGLIIHSDDFFGMLNKQTRAINTGMARNKRFNKSGLADEDQVQRGVFRQAGDTSWNNAVGTEVPTHCINRDDRSGQGLLVSALIDHFTTTVNAFWRNMVTQVNFTGSFLDRQGAGVKSIVRTTHITGGTGFFVLLNSHN